ncbi:PRA1 family protein H-like, partial [Salvia splendens]|uniref:PRA1 family protein H-like n=1 Tax=Salvia splendens TaxID=180675 RepID=UPI001C25964E
SRVFLPKKQKSLNPKQMFDPNPLSLSVPESEFESWLRDSGYLEIVDQRATDLHRISTAAKPSDSAAESATAKISSSGAFIVSRFLSRVWTLLSLLTFNPFSKLAATDFSGDTPPWTVAFFGSSESYSFPSSRSQARLRVHENVKRYARNYTTLFFLFFACSLYQLPLALFGLLSCLALWDAFRFSGDRWRLDGYPLLREALIRTAQCLAAVILFISNVQFAVFCATGVSFAVMILHASFRKLTPAKQPDQRGGQRTMTRGHG